LGWKHSTILVADGGFLQDVYLRWLDITSVSLKKTEAFLLIKSNIKFYKSPALQ
jgi:hypothetical protein